MKNILKSIGGFFAKLFKSVVSGGGPTMVQLPDNIGITPELIDHCINVVNNIKSVVNNPVLILVTDLTPISLDNTIRLKLAEALPAILAGLTYSKNFLNTDDKNAAVNGILEKIRLSDDPDKDALYHVLAARLIMVASDGRVTWSEAIGLIELYFKQIFSAPKVITTPLPVAAPAEVSTPVIAVSETVPDDKNSPLAGGPLPATAEPVIIQPLQLTKPLDQDTISAFEAAFANVKSQVIIPQ